MDVDAHVAVLAERRRAGVQADPDAHGCRPVVAAKPPLGVGGRRRGCGGRHEDGEQLVSAAVDLVTRRCTDGVPQEAADVREDCLPLVAELTGEPGRALDVREQEGDGAARERCHHGESGGFGGMSLVAGVCWAFRGKDAGSVDSGCYRRY